MLFDLPSVVDGAGPQMKTAGVAERCEVVGGSFFEPMLEGGDAYVMKSILHDWSDDDAERILRIIRGAIAPGGKLILLETVLPERPSSHVAVMFDLEMMVALHGKERTRAEWTALLRRAGFRLERVVDTAGPVAVIETTPFNRRRTFLTARKFAGISSGKERSAGLVLLLAHLVRRGP